MKSSISVAILACGLLQPIATALAQERIPLENFAKLEAISDASISPDGHLLTAVASSRQSRFALVMDRSSGFKPIGRLDSDKNDEFDIDWCGWVSNKRILCSYSKTEVATGGYGYPISRLVAADADASHAKMLIARTEYGTITNQTNVIDWNAGPEETVLVQARKSYEYGVYPSVYALNTRTGEMHLNTTAKAPIQQFISDGNGQVRLGFGVDKSNFVYMGRLDSKHEWKILSKFEPFAKSRQVTPFAMLQGTNILYAGGDQDGRTAIWKFDLEEKEEPTLVFSHPVVDIPTALYARNRRLIGFKYHTEEPHAYYTDPVFREASANLNRSLPNTFNEFIDMTQDEKTFLIRSYSDVEAGRWWIYDAEKSTLQSIGRERPDLPAEKMAPMRWIHYKAADGTTIPGYLTVPLGKKPEHLPLIVMPHGGPISRDTLEFDFLVQFLANRGYAVLQMNFRGSDGYGFQWLHDAHQDWGGLTYSDITDAARWAIAQGIADPDKVCIVGWSFGGYSALLGAVRNSDIYHCAASIAGISDLNQLEFEAGALAENKIGREYIGTDWEKLKRDSPRRHADEIKIPVLLIHGNHDYTVLPRQSREMADVLKSAGKPHRYVEIKGANHQIWRESERIILLQSLESFLAENLGPGNGH
jgi:dipeptidyl aminopeptidase/acylaminoacyl peptidase